LRRLTGFIEETSTNIIYTVTLSEDQRQQLKLMPPQAKRSGAGGGIHQQEPC